MDNELFALFEADGVRVDGVNRLQVASLRYFASHENFSAQVRQIAGRELPQPLTVSPPGGTHDLRCVLAWRSPSETLLLSDDAGVFAEFKQRLGQAPDGCLVDQTGGFSVIRLHGSKIGELMRRLGSDKSIPAPGEARTSRLADIQVLTLCLQPQTLLLIVERVYLGHLLGWIDKTLADFSTAPLA
jgi:hypothetical protein